MEKMAVLAAVALHLVAKPQEPEEMEIRHQLVHPKVVTAVLVLEPLILAAAVVVALLLLAAPELQLLAVMAVQGQPHLFLAAASLMQAVVAEDRAQLLLQQAVQAAAVTAVQLPCLQQQARPIPAAAGAVAGCYLHF